MEWSDDVAFAKQTLDSWVSAVDWLVSYRSKATALIDLNKLQNAFRGPPSGSAINTAAVKAFQGMASVAAAVNDVLPLKSLSFTTSQSPFQRFSTKSSQVIETIHLII
ncbi:uncharacterized protein BO88DRAFT_478935 [Aspergillus vadensis CBS 113365]|uniref:Uncharacterized protein n=1 Tax=Aspergillus vadensis (strain CBS 113365 / IMI 142717 / IBT 24658) TaxID=1448311 RepID=A0A319BJ45_ASPVC|nr:hypothetical protein BO88DRAFT_478935 [Aspergillus vadensis CBS 113365]PYH70930.1 hypothetical protein BO88DRAFT_478935 [Aspergillus vadensis CBS 113365]